MNQVTEQQVLEALKTVDEPERQADIVSLGMVSGLVVKDGNVGFAIEQGIVMVNDGGEGFRVHVGRGQPRLWVVT